MKKLMNALAISALLLSGCSSSNQEKKVTVYLVEKLEKYDKNNKLVSVTNSKYNESGVITEKVVLDSRNKEIGKTTYKLDDNGKLLSAKEISNENGEKEIFENEFDENGYCLLYKEDYGDYGNIYKYIRNSEGEITETKIYDLNEKLKSTMTEKKEKDSKGNETKIEYYADNKLNQTTLCEYDEHNMVTSYKYILQDGSESVYKYKNTYDGDKLIKRLETDEDGNEISSFERKYDKNGNMIENHYKSYGEEYTEKITYKAIELTASQKEYAERLKGY